MKKVIRIFIYLLLFPLAGICQQLTLTTPQWANDIGGAGTSTVVASKIDASNNVYVTGTFNGTVDFDPSAGVKNLTATGGVDTYIAKYDTNGLLIWAVSAGGSGDDLSAGLAIDAAGNIAISGQYNSPAMLAGSTTLTNAGGNDMFLISLDTNGNFLWGKSIGGTGTDAANGVAISKNGSRIVVGQFQSTIIVGSNTFTTTGTYNGLVAKYNAAGTLTWAFNLGQTGDNGVHSVAVDASNNIIIAGSFSGSVNFNPLGTANNLTAAGTASYIAKYTAAGILSWVQPISGTIVNDDITLAVGSNNYIYATGPFTASLTLATGTTVTSPGSQDAFLVKYDPTGAIQFGEDIAKGDTATAVTTSRALTVGTDGNIYVTGYFSGGVNFDPAGFTHLRDHGQQDLFIAKYASNGGIWWATNTGNATCGTTTGQTINLDSKLNVVIGGAFCSVVNFDFTDCTTYDLTAQSSVSDSYVIKYVPGADIAENNIITAPAVSTFCGSGDPATIVGTVPFGGTGAITYYWQSSADSVSFDRIPDITTKDYDPPVTTTTIYYRRYATTGTCITPISSNIIGIHVQPAITNNVITAPADTSFCSSGDAGVITGSPPAGGTGVYTYQWQSSADSITFSNIAGANSVSYDPPVATATTYYQRLVTSGACTTPFISNIIKIRVDPALGNNVITAPAVTLLCATGDPAVITGSTATGGNGVYAYQWQASADSVTFNNITGATASNYDPPVINATTYYRRTVISGICTTPLLSNVIAIHVQPAILNNVITPPSIANFCLTGDPTTIVGSVPTGGNGTLTYQWQSSTDSVTFNDMPGITSKDYDPPLLTTIVYYRRNVLSGTCLLVSNTVTIVIQTPIVNNVISAPATAATCLINGNVPTGGTSHFTYQWQSSADDINFTDINGATGQNYSPLTSGVTMYYRRVASSGTCFPSAISNTVTVLAMPDINNNIITAPAVTLFCVTGNPGNITGSTPTGGNGTYTYQWQSSTDNVSFTDISAATAVNYTMPAIIVTTYYRRIAMSGACLTPSLSNVITLTVQPAIANNVITPPAIGSFCVSGNVSAITGSTPTGGDGSNYTYQWQNSADGVSFTDIAGAVTVDYTPPVLTATTYFRRLVTSSGSCTTPVTSNVVTITRQLGLANNNITAPAVVHFCTAINPDIITGTAATGGDGSVYAYQWQSSTDSVTFNDIAGATSQNYDPPAITVTTFYRRLVISGTCTTPLISNVITIIQDPMVVASAGSDQTICLNGSVVLTATGGTSYQWSPAAGLSNTNTANPIASPTVTTTYTVTVFKGTCSATAMVTVNVVQVPTNVNAGTDVTVIKGHPVQLNGSATGSNLKYLWTPSTYLDNPNIANPIATPQSDITYTLTVIAQNNCFVVNDQVAVKVFSNVLAPNTFTPNGDGINDTWMIPALVVYPNCVVSIFNRYGAEVFRSIGYPNAWDGTYNGKQVPSGTYYYTIDLRDGSKIISGWLAVIR